MVNIASILAGAAAATSFISTVAAHPGEKHDHVKIKREIDVRGLRAAAAKRSLAECQDTLKHRSLMRRAEARRANTLDALREKRGITASTSFVNSTLICSWKLLTLTHRVQKVPSRPGPPPGVRERQSQYDGCDELHTQHSRQ